MPYKSRATKNKCAATSMRRVRLYRKAVADGHPLALEAEAARNPMRAFHVLRAEKDALPAEEREALKTAPAHVHLSRAHMERVYRECLALAAGGRYLELRNRVIAEMELEAIS